MEFVTFKKNFSTSIVEEEVRASSMFSVVAYEPTEKFFLCDDQSIGFAFMCEPLASADEKLQERLNGLLNQEFPKNTIVQFFLFRSPDIQHQLNQIHAIRDGFKDPILSAVIDERVEFLSKHTRDAIITETNRGTYNLGIVHDLKLMISVKVPIAGNVPNKNEEMTLKQLKTKVNSSLQSVYLHPTPVTARTYKRFMSVLFNWSQEASWKYGADDWEEDKPICDQILDFDTDVEVSSKRIRVGSYYLKLLSAKKLPDKMYFGDAISYVGDISGSNSGIKENYFIAMNVYFPDPESTKGKLTRKRQFTVNQAYGPLLKFVPELADKKTGFDLLYDAMKEGSKPLRVTYTMGIFAPTEDRVEAAAMSARNIWRESRFELMEDKFVCLPVFLNHLPFCADREAIRDLGRYKTLASTHAAPLLPIFGEWKGTGTFHATLVSRNGQIMSQSVHDSDTNKNLVISAESGSGKSFEVNELITSYMSEGAQVWVVDAGKSYQKLAEQVGGDFVHFGETSKVCLAPFKFVENYEDEEDAIISNISAMASQSGSLIDLQRSALKQITAMLWAERGNALQIDDIAQRCLENEDQRIKDVGQQLYAFTSNGSYGKYFTGDNNISFQKQFTVLELDELQGRKHLRQVVLLQLIYQIQQEVFLGERNRKKLVIIDEAWDLLKEGEVSVFMEHAYRKFRKYGGTVIIATQSINDLYSNEVGRAIAENSSSMYLLGQTEESIESVKREKRLVLSDGGFNALKSVHTVKGVYSEIFLKTKSGIGIGRLIVGEMSKLLYSTAPEDVADIDIEMKRDPSINVTEAIRRVIMRRNTKRL